MSEFMQWIIAGSIAIPVVFIVLVIRSVQHDSKQGVEQEPYEYESTMPDFYKNINSKPQKKRGPRGGRYTEARTKDGRPYRRYF